MPVTKSAAKRVRQQLKRHKRNLRIKNNMKRDIKALLSAIAESDAKGREEKLKKAQSSVDKAAKANVIHKNKAAREKSKLAKAALGKKKTISPAKTSKKVSGGQAKAKPAAKAKATPKTQAKSAKTESKSKK